MTDIDISLEGPSNHELLGDDRRLTLKSTVLMEVEKVKETSQDDSLSSYFLVPVPDLHLEFNANRKWVVLKIKKNKI